MIRGRTVDLALWETPDRRVIPVKLAPPVDPVLSVIPAPWVTPDHKVRWAAPVAWAIQVRRVIPAR